jgi:hypothetical protein
MTSVTLEKIREFSHSTVIQYLWVSASDVETDLENLRKFILPSLKDPNHKIQELGISSLLEIIESHAEETLLPVPNDEFIRILIPFLDPNSVSSASFCSTFSFLFPCFPLKSFKREVVEILYHYSYHVSPEDFLPTGALSAFIPILSDSNSAASTLLSYLAVNDDKISEFLYSHSLLSQVILRHIHIDNSVLDKLLSNASSSQVTAAFSDICSHKCQWKTTTLSTVSCLIRRISRRRNVQTSVLQAIANSNLLKFTIEELFASDGEFHFAKYSLDIISDYAFCCHRIITNSNVFESFIPCLKKHRFSWEVLLPCVAEIIQTLPDLHSTLPLDLIPYLLSLECCEEVCKCVLRITSRTLSLHDHQFLQHLVDNGLLTFLSSSLKLKEITRSVLSRLINRILQIDEKYLEAITALELVPSASE